jgi:hypothetical protein
VGEFKGVQPAQAVSVPDLELRNLSLPRRFYSNGSVYLHVLAVTTSDEVLRHSAVKISRHVLQAGRKEPTRYLLTETKLQELTAAQPVSSLPRIIEVGFVQETESMNSTALAEKGLQGYIKGKSLQLPLFVNTLISPRDEYVPLLQADSVSDASLSSSTEPVGFDVRFRNIGMGYWTLQFQISLAFDDAEKMIQMNEYDVDSFKQMVGGSSPSKIVGVYGIAILHLVFGYLAFTNDINFWRTKTSFEGFSSSFGSYAGMYQYHLVPVRAGAEADQIRDVHHRLPLLHAALEAPKNDDLPASPRLPIRAVAEPRRCGVGSRGAARDCSR